ncbi:MAG: TonB-dependent receptor [Bacteroidales bacterium]|nr:TonB-dependent receptor [Bacteroidales bacterium]
MQIQRGVGTFTNGTGAFGASINLETQHFSSDAYGEVTYNIGSFNTNRKSMALGSGLLGKGYFLEGRYTDIKSDGYIDRAWADMQQYFVQGGFYNGQTLVKAIAFGGLEETYQAWNGVDSSTIEARGRTFNSAGIYGADDGTENVYENFIDHYQQDHQQLIISHAFNRQLSANVTLHHTHGMGYYEEYMHGDSVKNYTNQAIAVQKDSVTFDTVFTANLARRLWLDNDFYGVAGSVTCKLPNVSQIIGGGASFYPDAQHFGEIIESSEHTILVPGHEFYRNTADKNEWNVFSKTSYDINARLGLYFDLQVRGINYQARGLNREYDNRTIDIKDDWLFFNPKAGLTYQPARSLMVYGYYAQTHREPNRKDFLNMSSPKAEKLEDVELGFRFENALFNASLNGFYMKYTDQLVNTGKVDGGGAPIHQNVENSYRLGLEASGAAIYRNWFASANFTLMDSKIVLDNDTVFAIDTTNKNIVKQGNKFYTSVSYSPNTIASGTIGYNANNGFGTNVSAKHVGQYFINNTSDDNFKVKGYVKFDTQVAIA